MEMFSILYGRCTFPALLLSHQIFQKAQLSLQESKSDRFENSLSLALLIKFVPCTAKKGWGVFELFPNTKDFFTHGGFEGNKKFPKVENDFGCSFVKIIHWQWFRRQNIWFDEGTVLLSAILHEPIQQGECICIHKQPLNILYLPSSMHWLIDWLIDFSCLTLISLVFITLGYVNLAFKVISLLVNLLLLGSSCSVSPTLQLSCNKNTN